MATDSANKGEEFPESQREVQTHVFDEIQNESEGIQAKAETFVVDFGKKPTRNLQDAFLSYKNERQKELNKVKRKRRDVPNEVRLRAMADPDNMWKLRIKFLEQAKKYFGVPYGRRYWKAEDPEYNSKYFLDCCGLVRRVMRDLKKDFGFKIGPWNQSYMCDTLPITVEREADMKPGDLVFISAIYYNEKMKKQKHNLTHVEIWLGDGPKTIGARWHKGKVQVFDSYRFKATSYHSEKYIFKSIDTWLMGICRSHCPVHTWKLRSESFNPSKKSVFSVPSESNQECQPAEEADESAGDSSDDGTTPSAGKTLQKPQSPGGTSKQSPGGTTKQSPRVSPNHSPGGSTKSSQNDMKQSTGGPTKQSAKKPVIKKGSRSAGSERKPKTSPRQGAVTSPRRAQSDTGVRQVRVSTQQMTLGMGVQGKPVGRQLQTNNDESQNEKLSPSGSDSKQQQQQKKPNKPKSVRKSPRTVNKKKTSPRQQKSSPPLPLTPNSPVKQGTSSTTDITDPPTEHLGDVISAAIRNVTKIKPLQDLNPDDTPNLDALCIEDTNNSTSCLPENCAKNNLQQTNATQVETETGFISPTRSSSAGSERSSEFSTCSEGSESRVFQYFSDDISVDCADVTSIAASDIVDEEMAPSDDKDGQQVLASKECSDEPSLVLSGNEPNV